MAETEWSRLKPVVQAVTDVEKDMQLWEETIDGVYFWDWVRQKAVYQAPTIASGEGGGVLRGITASVRDAHLLLRNTLVRNPLLADEADLLFLGSRRGRTASPEDEDIYCDPIIDRLDSRGWSYLLLETPYNHRHVQPPAERTIRYLEFIDYTASLLTKLGLSRVTLDEEDRSLLNAVEQRLREDAGHTIDLERLVRRTLGKRKAALPLYRRLLRRVDPKVVVLGRSSGGQETFIAACKQLEIPVVELQHGVLSRYHLASAFPDGRTKHAFPDYFFVWGDFWKEHAAFPIPDEQVYSVGFPFHEREREAYRDTASTEQVVFVSQPVIGEQLSKVAVALRQQLPETDIVYKLHPDEHMGEADSYPRLEDSGVTVIGDERPLYDLFSASTAQVGVYSTALFEGLSFDLDTYLVDMPGIEHVQEFAASDAVTVVASAAELAENLSNPQTEPRGDVDQFFRPNAIDHMLDALEEVIQKHGR